MVAVVLAYPTQYVSGCYVFSSAHSNIIPTFIDWKGAEVFLDPVTSQTGASLSSRLNWHSQSVLLPATALGTSFSLQLVGFVSTGKTRALADEGVGPAGGHRAAVRALVTRHVFPWPLWPGPRQRAHCSSGRGAVAMKHFLKCSFYKLKGVIRPLGKMHKAGLRIRWLVCHR